MNQEKERGPAAVTTEPPCNAVGAIAGSTYRRGRVAGNSAVSAPSSDCRREHGVIAFRAQTGRVWRYSGKRGQVLPMLATMSGGVTQWDTLPWHTRLGGTVHILREDGLAIETEREGQFRHARYWLRTEGSLQGEAEQ